MLAWVSDNFTVAAGFAFRLDIVIAVTMIYKMRYDYCIVKRRIALRAIRRVGMHASAR
jgi:hypothetical protein